MQEGNEEKEGEGREKWKKEEETSTHSSRSGTAGGRGALILTEKVEAESG